MGNTAATYAACNTGKSLEVCSDLHYDDFECFHRVTMNRSGEVIQLETGCKQGNACRTAERQNYVGGIALRNQCKPDPSVFGPRFNGRSVCNTCFPLCTADTVDCFDPNNQSGFVPGIYDGAAYHGAVGDHQLAGKRPWLVCYHQHGRILATRLLCQLVDYQY